MKNTHIIPPLEVETFPAPLFESSSLAHEIRIWWLGQAGFAVQYQDLKILIDPYLSDYLAHKYRNHEFHHKRMMDIPILPEDLTGIHFVLCTHRHSDHMDPWTLPVIAKNNPNCFFLVPRAEKDYANTLGIPSEKVIGIDHDEVYVHPKIKINAVAAAHEVIKTNEEGNHHFLGYIVSLGSIRIYHSGDCVPWEGLVPSLSALVPDMALLPVNGRDEYRNSRNILGNFTLEEALSLCKEAGIVWLVGHHIEMFEFNTIPRQTMLNSQKNNPHKVHLIVPNIGEVISLRKQEG